MRSDGAVWETDDGVVGVTFAGRAAAMSAADEDALAVPGPDRCARCVVGGVLLAGVTHAARRRDGLWFFVQRFVCDACRHDTGRGYGWREGAP